MTAFHKRVHSLCTFWAGFADMFRHARERRAIVRRQRLDCAFIEQLSLLVSRVNGCRLCTYVHAANALRSGLSDEELQELLVFIFAGDREPWRTLDHRIETIVGTVDMPRCCRFLLTHAIRWSSGDGTLWVPPSPLHDAHTAAGLRLHQVAAPLDALWHEQCREELEGEHDLQQRHQPAPAPRQRAAEIDGVEMRADRPVVAEIAAGEECHAAGPPNGKAAPQQQGDGDRRKAHAKEHRTVAPTEMAQQRLPGKDEPPTTSWRVADR